MDQNMNNKQLEYLYRAILTLQTVEDCKSFLEDLCTPSELSEMSRRLQAAHMLNDGMIYTEIAEQTGLSTATISRVRRALEYGNGGYRTVIDRLDKAEEK